MGQFDELFRGIASQRPITSMHAPHIPAGLGQVYFLAKLTVKKTEKKGNSVTADLVCVSPGNGAAVAGQVYGVIWNASAGGYEGEYARDRLGGFVRELLGCPVEAVQQALNDLTDASQRGRGIAIRADVTPATDAEGKPRRSARGEQFHEIAWGHIDGGKQNVPAQRAHVDTVAPLRAETSAPAATPPPSNPAPAAAAPPPASAFSAAFATPPPAASPTPVATSPAPVTTHWGF